MSAPQLPLFQAPVPLPAEPVPTQVAGAARLTPHVRSLRETTLFAVGLSAARGATPTQVAEWVGCGLVTARARCTELHQAGELIRTAIRREHQYVYVVPKHWNLLMGRVESRHHRGKK